jgi:hypothetical protein
VTPEAGRDSELGTQTRRQITKGVFVISFRLQHADESGQTASAVAGTLSQPAPTMSSPFWASTNSARFSVGSLTNAVAPRRHVNVHQVRRVPL